MTMSEAGDRYRMAEQLVFKRYLTEPGEKGQPQSWKIKAIEDDRESGNFDSGVMNLFAIDVEAEVARLESVAPIVVQMCQEVCKSSSSSVEVQPLKPSEPPSPHGMDLDWN